MVGVWLIRNHGNRRLAAFLITMSAIAELLLGPCLMKASITVSAQEYCDHGGLWYSPNTHRFAFEEVRFIQDGFWIDSKGKRLPQWNVHLKDGSVLQVPKGDLWRANKGRVTQLLLDRGVRFE